VTTATNLAAAPAGGAAGRRAPTRRNVELAMIFFGYALTVAMSAMSEGAMVGSIRGDSLALPTAMLALALIAHAIMRIFAPYADPSILPCVMLINSLGVIMIHRVDVVREADDSPSKFGSIGVFDGVGYQQVIWSAVGILAFCLTLSLVKDHKALSRYAYTLGLTGIVLVGLPAVLPASISEVNGAKVWIKFGIGSVQPGEFAKLLLFIFFAYYLVRKREVLSLASKRILGIDFPRARDMGPVIVVWIVSVLILVVEKDLGGSILYLGTFVVMLYVATERRSWLIIGFLLFAVGAFSAYTLGTVLGPFQNFHDRVNIWLHPTHDPHGAGLQVLQSMISFGVGGLFGAGPGQGDPNFVPLNRSDFILSPFGEDLGLFGMTALLLLYLLFVLRGMKAALSVRDSFGKLLAAGLAFSMALELFAILGGVTDMIPMTGQTTPFLSYGGSSLVANWILVALLLRISHAARQPVGAGPGGPAGPPTKLQSAATEVIRL
jgi:cell division protein FtsW (lipid II flippase)